MSQSGELSVRPAFKPKVFKDPLEKLLYNKVNTLKRNRKDLEVCKKEVLVEQERLEKFQKSFPDKVSQQENVLSETKVMVPDAENRLRSAIMDLSDFLEKERGTLTCEEEISEAHKLLTEAQKDLSFIE